MGIDDLEILAEGLDIVLDHGGTVYCWPCFRKVIGPAPGGLRVTGRRIGRETCKACGRAGSVVLEVERY